jgi:hypothetical protein
LRKLFCISGIYQRRAFLEGISEHRKPHRYADFKQKTKHQYPRKTVIDALLMMLDLFLNR